MTENLTREHQLVDEISTQGWLANPAGRQGYEVIVLEKIGEGGTRFYCSLKPGETLRFGERLFGKYTLLAVDIRHARYVTVEGQFATYERGHKVSLKAKVRYRVVDARVVAMDTIDPLGELRDKVIATLNRELVRHQEANITPATIEQIIRSVGTISHLGLTIEDTEVIEFSSDSRVVGQTLAEKNLEHDLSLNNIRERAELDSKTRQREAELESQRRAQEENLRWRQEQQEAIDLTDINALMHEHPELVQQIFGTFANRDEQLLAARLSLAEPVIKDYIKRQQEIDGEIDPTEIARLMQQFAGPTPPSLQNPQLVWGDRDEETSSTDEPKVTFAKEEEEEEEEKKSGKKPPNDTPRIKFGD
jgi:hypothetical protein